MSGRRLAPPAVQVAPQIACILYGDPGCPSKAWREGITRGAIAWYHEQMNQLSPRLARALEQAKGLPTETQNAAAEIIERLAAQAAAPYQLSADEEADLDAALAEAERGEFASDAEVAAVFARHGL
jgi:hypothetical protein